MDGAVAFDYSKITARQMLNLDSEDENEAIVSCAGGCHLKTFRTFDKTAASGSALRVRVGGFAGGHSGSDIHLGKGNAARRRRLRLRMRRQRSVLNVTATAAMRLTPMPQSRSAS